MRTVLVRRDFSDQRTLMETSNEKGQSTVEFILTFAFGVSLILVIFNTSLNHATGYLVHYATFMASRVYLTADSHVGSVTDVQPSLQTAEQRAVDAFNQYNLSVFNIPNGNFKVNKVNRGQDPSEFLTVGTLTTFELYIDILGRITGSKKLEQVSESFLGKEPTRAECAARVCRAIVGSETCTQDMDITLYDDGC